MHVWGQRSDSRPRVLAAAFLGFAALLSGCGKDEPTAVPLGGSAGCANPWDAGVALDAANDAGVLHEETRTLTAAPLPGQTTCRVVTQEALVAVGSHVAECSDIAYPTKFPTQGLHYPIWAAYRAYGGPVPEGYLVHDLEHGAVVISYRCDGDCSALRTRLEAFYKAFPHDARCTAPVNARLILVPDSTLDVPLLARAWGRAYRATCLDEADLRAWALCHYAQSYEDVCADGLDFSAVDGGTQVTCADGGVLAPDAGDAGDAGTPAPDAAPDGP